MVLIKIKSKDKEKVFEILANNGSFTGLSGSRFLIIENTELVLQKLRDAGIDFEEEK